MAIGKKTGGRTKGVPNKTTAGVKAAIQDCFEQLGGVEAFAAWAKDNQTDFYKCIWLKLLPLSLANDVENPILNNLTIEFIKTRPSILDIP